MKKVKKAQGTFAVPFSGFCISAFLGRRVKRYAPCGSHTKTGLPVNSVTTDEDRGTNTRARSGQAMRQHGAVAPRQEMGRLRLDFKSRLRWSEPPDEQSVASMRAISLARLQHSSAQQDSEGALSKSPDSEGPEGQRAKGPKGQIDAARSGSWARTRRRIRKKEVLLLQYYRTVLYCCCFLRSSIEFSWQR